MEKLSKSEYWKMKRNILKISVYLLFLVLIFAISYCNIVKGKKTIDHRVDTFHLDVKVKAAFKLIERNDSSLNMVIIDVRRPEERVEGFIENSLNIDFKDENFAAKIDLLDKNKAYLVYCQGGYRSKKAMVLMKNKGFKRVFNLKGGFLVWKSKKLPVIK